MGFFVGDLDQPTDEPLHQSFPKPERRKRTKARKVRAKRRDAADVRVYVFGRERDLCRCCRKRRAQSLHELQFRSQGGKVSKRNSVAVCGDGVRGCHGFLQRHEIEWEEHNAIRRAEGTLTFFPLSMSAAEWLGIRRGTKLESPVMQETEISS